ncbi:uncharacterized protein DUF1851 [Nitrospirillum amazonense]|uniref:Uncharacterized protein DUF1851 n=1 Tax=Nitrospirillum amazonense TaxID=28077 RepID=A0A560FMK4_9PROT|nr:T6SS immunity protein Tdi1 domain-containing protein [Nitrospirillum amazonense]TWB22781.1 uncharacterized protein DUF1851 [Nitrospirillum amazonense]
MFDKFKKHFQRDNQAIAGDVAGVTTSDPMMQEFFKEIGGLSFKSGLYRTLHPTHVGDWNARVLAAFPAFKGRILCFAYDWLGRAFALDAARLEDKKPGVILFEPGTGEAMEIPANLTSFHEAELIDYGDAALAESFYRQWRASGGSPPAYDQCVGYRKPLFLGGADTVDNLETSDLDVYWHLAAQLIRKTRALPSGTPVHLNLT